MADAQRSGTRYGSIHNSYADLTYRCGGIQNTLDTVYLPARAYEHHNGTVYALPLLVDFYGYNADGGLRYCLQKAKKRNRNEYIITYAYERVRFTATRTIISKITALTFVGSYKGILIKNKSIAHYTSQKAKYGGLSLSTKD